MTLYDELVRILDCAETELVEAGRSVPPEVFVAPGLPAFETHCGQLWARVVRIYKADPWPLEADPSLIRCNTALVAEVGLGITRCQSGVRRLEDGGHPLPAEQSSDAEGLVCDAGALLRALVCCYPALENAAEVATGAWEQLEPQGAVVGGEWSAFIDADLYCEPSSPGDSP